MSLLGFRAMLATYVAANDVTTITCRECSIAATLIVSNAYAGAFVKNLPKTEQNIIGWRLLLIKLNTKMK